jgi:hypothetical protein
VFNWDISDEGVVLEYTGTPERLIACGAAEPHMIERGSKLSPVQRRDSAGHAFRREARRAKLKITRWISDPKFAETLPGVPRGLRFKRLDWLDANPGKVHVAVAQYTEHVHVRKWTRSAGTAEALIAAGFPTMLFGKRLRRRPFYNRSITFYGLEEERDIVQKGGHGNINTLMRGYIEICIEEPADKTLPMPDRDAKPVWTTHGCDSETATAEILKRFARGTVRP